MTLQDDAEELARAWDDLLQTLLRDRQFHVLLGTAWLTLLGVCLFMVLT